MAGVRVLVLSGVCVVGVGLLTYTFALAQFAPARPLEKDTGATKDGIRPRPLEKDGSTFKDVAPRRYIEKRPEPAPAAPTQTIEELLVALERIKEERALLDQREEKLKEALAKRLAEQQERLKKVGYVIPGQALPPVPIPPSVPAR